MKASSVQATHATIRPIAPFRLDLTVWALRRRARNIVDRWDGNVYRRTFVIDSRPVEISVSQMGPPNQPMLHLQIDGAKLDNKSVASIRDAVQKILGTNIDLAPFYRLAERDELLHELMSRFRGLKPPRFPTVFESLVNAISCQQLSLTVGIELLNRLTRETGVKAPSGGRAFPRPCDVLSISVETFRQLGLSGQKAKFILSLAERVNNEEFNPGVVESSSNEAAREALLKIPGVGRWTAEYTLMRGFGRLDIFPGDDVGARNGLMRWLNRTEKQMDYEGIQQIVERWRPYAGFVYLHLLLDGLARSGEMELAPEMTRNSVA